MYKGYRYELGFSKRAREKEIASKKIIRAWPERSLKFSHQYPIYQARIGRIRASFFPENCLSDERTGDRTRGDHVVAVTHYFLQWTP